MYSSSYNHQSSSKDLKLKKTGFRENPLFTNTKKKFNLSNIPSYYSIPSHPIRPFPQSQSFDNFGVAKSAYQV
jgi:hypothetical protein